MTAGFLKFQHVPLNEKGKTWNSALHNELQRQDEGGGGIDPSAEAEELMAWRRCKHEKTYLL